MLNFDPEPVNISTFDLVQFALDKPAVEYNFSGKKAIFVALGDSAVSSHFYSASGLSAARIFIERTVKFLKQCNEMGKCNTEYLIERININFEMVKSKVLHFGKKYVESRESAVIQQIAQKTMCSKVNEMIRDNTIFNDHGFKVKSVGNVYPGNAKFEIEIGTQVYSASVTKDGKIMIEKEPKFSYGTVFHAVSSLHNLKP
uniref:Uncharacterized protein n=1 Tax=Ditylenchus dipsaci TaxID=166011 RepID=A0A915EPC1_9BILA